MTRELRGIPGDKDFIMSLSHAMGFLAVNFGQFEFALNAAITIIHHLVGQPIKDNGHLPYMLKERLRYVREAAGRYSALDPYRRELREIAIEAKRLSKIRNGVLHAYPADYDADTRTLTFLGVAPDKEDRSMHRESRHVITVEKLLSEGIASEALGTKSIMLCHRLLKELTAEHGIENSLGTLSD
jgi:hypothetical protein